MRQQSSQKGLIRGQSEAELARPTESRGDDSESEVLSQIEAE